MRTNTKKFAILKFIGQHPGVTSSDVEKFIVTGLNSQTWDSKKRAGLWNISLYGYGSSRQRVPGIYEKHCVRVDGRWYLNPETVREISRIVPEIIRGYGGGPSITNTDYATDRISANGSVLTINDLPVPKLARETELIPIPPKKEAVVSELDNLSVEELELEAIKVLREARAALKAKTEEFHRVSRELLDAKNAEKEAATVLRQALGL